MAEIKEELKREITQELKPVLIEDVLTEANDRATEEEEDGGNPNPWNLVARRNQPTPNMREIIHDEMEKKQIDLIKLNLVMSGILESNSSAEDLQKAKDLINTELHITAEIEKVVRCGKTRSDDPSKPRLLKLFMKNQNNRKQILQNAKNLRDSEDEHTKTKVYISPDQTKKQQLESKNLRDELRKVKLDNPLKTFKIQRGAIIEVVEVIDRE